MVSSGAGTFAVMRGMTAGGVVGAATSCFATTATGGKTTSVGGASGVFTVGLLALLSLFFCLLSASYVRCCALFAVR